LAGEGFFDATEGQVYEKLSAADPAV